MDWYFTFTSFFCSMSLLMSSLASLNLASTDHKSSQSQIKLWWRYHSMCQDFIVVNKSCDFPLQTSFMGFTCRQAQIPLRVSASDPRYLKSTKHNFLNEFLLVLSYVCMCRIQTKYPSRGRHERSPLVLEYA